VDASIAMLHSNPTDHLMISSMISSMPQTRLNQILMALTNWGFFLLRSVPLTIDCVTADKLIEIIHLLLSFHVFYNPHIPK
jgi:hypothetical protein